MAAGDIDDFHLSVKANKVLFSLFHPSLKISKRFLLNELSKTL